MAKISSDVDLRAHLRRELGLSDSSQVTDEDIDAEIQSAKQQMSEEVAHKVQRGEPLNFYENAGQEALVNFLKVRLSPASPRTSMGRKRGRGKGRGRIPRSHPRAVGHVRRADFDDPQVNFWRNRMVRALNRI